MEYLLLLAYPLIVLHLWGWARVFGRLGYSRWLAVPMSIPFIYWLMFLWFAFWAKWLKKPQTLAPP